MVKFAKTFQKLKAADRIVPLLLLAWMVIFSLLLLLFLAVMFLPSFLDPVMIDHYLTIFFNFMVAVAVGTFLLLFFG